MSTRQQRELSLYGFDIFCERQTERILRKFTGTELDRDLPREQIDAAWRKARLGPALQFKDSVKVEVKR